MPYPFTIPGTQIKVYSGDYYVSGGSGRIEVAPGKWVLPESLEEAKMAVSDADLFYSEGAIGPAWGGVVQPTLMPMPGTGGPRPPAVAVITVTLAMLVRVMGVVAGTAAYGILRGIVGVGAAFTGRMWSLLPGWVKAGLALVGLEEGAEFLVTGDVDFDPLQPPSGDGNGGVWQLPDLPWSGGDTVPDSPTHALHGGVAKSWKNPTTGLWGAKYADGWMGAQRKDGTWTAWKPRKPIVIFTTGSGDLRTTLKAFKAASGQLTKVSKAAEKLYKVRYRERCGVCGYVRCRCSK